LAGTITRHTHKVACSDHSFEYTVTVVRAAGLNTDGGRAIEKRWSSEDNNRDAIVTEEKSAVQ
jgi:hypothetical protein